MGQNRVLLPVLDILPQPLEMLGRESKLLHLGIDLVLTLLPMVVVMQPHLRGCTCCKQVVEAVLQVELHLMHNFLAAECIQVVELDPTQDLANKLKLEVVELTHNSFITFESMAANRHITMLINYPYPL